MLVEEGVHCLARSCVVVVLVVQIGSFDSVARAAEELVNTAQRGQAVAFDVNRPVVGTLR